MSIREMTRIWDKARTTDQGELLLLLAIADNANDSGYAWPGYKTLIKKTRTSRSSVIRKVKALEEQNALYVHRKPGDVNRYVILEGLTGQDLKDRYQFIQNKWGGVTVEPVSDNETGGGSQPETGGVSPMTPESSIKHKNNHHNKESDTPDPIDTIIALWFGDTYSPESLNTKEIAKVEGNARRVYMAFQEFGILESEEIKRFAMDWRTITGYELPTDPMKLKNHVNRWRKGELKPTPRKATPKGKTPAAQDVTRFISGKYAEDIER